MFRGTKRHPQLMSHAALINLPSKLERINKGPGHQ